MITMRPGIPGRRLAVMLVDDHEVVRRGVRALIEQMPDWTLPVARPRMARPR